MDLILIFFIFPLVTIILASVLEFIIRCPIAVAAIFFAIWLLVAYLLLGIEIFIIAVTVYTILAFLTALITQFILNNMDIFCGCGCCKKMKCCSNNDESNIIDDDDDDDNDKMCNKNTCCCHRRNNFRRF